MVHDDCGTSAEEDSIASKSIILETNKCSDTTGSSAYESSVLDGVDEEAPNDEAEEVAEDETGTERTQSLVTEAHASTAARGQNGDSTRNSKTPPSPLRGRGSACITPSVTEFKEATEDIVDGSIEKLRYQEETGEENADMTYHRQYAVDESRKAEEVISNMISIEQQHDGYFKRENFGSIPHFNAIVKNPHSISLHQHQHHHPHNHHHHDYSQQPNNMFTAAAGPYGIIENIALKQERFTEQNILSRPEQSSSVSGQSSEGYDNQASPSQQQTSNLAQQQHQNVQSSPLEHAFAVLSTPANDWKNHNSTTPSPLSNQNCSDLPNGEHHGSPNSSVHGTEIFPASNNDSHNLHNLQSSSQNMSMLHQVASYHQYNVSHDNGVSHHANVATDYSR